MKQAYQPPHKASAVQHKASQMPAAHKASQMPAAYKASAAQQKSTSYVAPQKRVENPLAPENFPVFQKTAVIHTTSKLNFKEMMQKAEDARQKALEAESYDPLLLQTLLPSQLEKEGWKCLSLASATTPSFLQRLNEPPATPEEDDNDYWLQRPAPSSLRPRMTCHDPELQSVSEESAGEEEAEDVV